MKFAAIIHCFLCCIILEGGKANYPRLRFVRGKPHFDEMREHNRQNRLRRERLQKAKTVQ